MKENTIMTAKEQKLGYDSGNVSALDVDNGYAGF